MALLPGADPLDTDALQALLGDDPQALLRAKAVQQSRGAVMRNPILDWMKEENASVMEPWWKTAARKAGHIIGADDPTSSVMAVLNPTETGETLAGKALTSIIEKGRGLYSRIDEAVSKLPAKAHANKVASILKSSAPAEEIAYRKIPEFLQQQGNTPVTPQSLLEHLKANPAPIPEVKTRQPAPPDLKAQVRQAELLADAASDKAFPHTTTHGQPWPNARMTQVEAANLPWWGREAAKGDADAMRKLEALDITPEHRQAVLEAGRLTNEFDRLRNQNTIDRPKYAQYTLPGGEHYKETLLTLPEKTALPEGWTTGPSSTDEGLIGVFNADGDQVTRAATADAAIAQAKQYSTASGGYRAGHFADTPNVLVHTRSNERTLPTGERGRFIEEVQSDLHQRGEKTGYQTPERAQAIKAARKEAEDRYNAFYDDIRRESDALLKSLNDKSDPMMAQRAQMLGKGEEYGRLLRENNDAIHADWELEKNPGIPDLPFKKTWPDLGLKQQILEAAEDPKAQWIGHTSGKTQAERYDLSKQIGEIHYSGSNLKAYDHDGNAVINQTGIRPEDLPDLIGKDVADKLLAQEPQGTLRSLTGQEIQVGGEGMEHFYDKLLPKRLEKILKPFGGTVEQTALGGRTKTQIDAEVDRLLAETPNANNYNRLSPEQQQRYNQLYKERETAMDENNVTAWIAKLTPEMKARILKEGLPLSALLALLGQSRQAQPPQEQ